MKKRILILLVITATLSLNSVCYAQGAFEKSMKKFGRGIINTATGWMEIPKQIYVTSSEENVALGLTWGTAKGVGMGVIRTGSGVIDMATFPFPINDYEPLLDPEFVFEQE